MAARVQLESFDLNHILYEMKKNNASVGAAVSFIGFVRDLPGSHQSEHLTSLYLEHYPGMTEKSLFEIENKAREKWNLEDVFIVHRVGELKLHDPIVGLIVLSAHRKDAFEACAFMMDHIKTEVPFWKKESTKEGSRWVEAKESDNEMKFRWNS
jgi:molybdopterin synthase catalytic subunit